MCVCGNKSVVIHHILVLYEEYFNKGTAFKFVGDSLMKQISFTDSSEKGS